MKKLFLFFSTILLTNFHSFSIPLKKEIFEKVRFESHTEGGRYGSWLGMNIIFAPIKELFETIDYQVKGKLNKAKARTEAHITVITPIEYRDILERYIKIEEINAIANKEFYKFRKNESTYNLLKAREKNLQKIQDSRFDIKCLGMASDIINRKDEKTFYLVVDSKNSINIRKVIFEIYKRRGGNPSKFDPYHYYPHITIGYTLDDLHLESHKVFKGLNTCIDKVIIK